MEVWRLEPGEHLVIALSVAVLGGRWLLDRGETRLRQLLGAGALAALPVLSLVTPARLTELLVGKEGVTEALTAGVLLALVWLAGRAREPVFALAALVLLGEELDWGQLVFAWPTPGILAELGSRSDAGNWHNLPSTDSSWRLVPLVVALVSAWRARLPQSVGDALDRLRCPRLDPGFVAGVAVATVGTVASWLLVGEPAADEAAELAAVALVATAWRPRL